uniref:hypothetical protein n=1 Tax=Galdieria phlegrea TaxID=1389228 RepID=UPI0023D8438B|nr:hypothetical protein P2030_pgp111 [Galdieria phlegrea]WDA99828.1 hypothetical protein GAPH629S_096 [Galdieria phlegrea]|eukprot:jgi/Galph1/1549/GphlegSOOS_G226.1
MLNSEIYNSFEYISVCQIKEALLKQDFQTANYFTYIYLLQLRKINLKLRPWFYFTDIKYLPSDKLILLDKLWQQYSNNKFGFTVQKKIWLKHEKNWNQFFQTIGWKKDNKLCRYPEDFIWNIEAPIGHLPLFNQIRGIQILKMLFEHKAFS